MALAGGETAPLLFALLSFVLGGSALGWTGLYLTDISESVPTDSAATGIGTLVDSTRVLRTLVATSSPRNKLDAL